MAGPTQNLRWLNAPGKRNETRTPIRRILLRWMHGFLLALALLLPPLAPAQLQDGARVEAVLGFRRKLGADVRPATNVPPRTYAILINGATEPHHQTNILAAYQILRQRGIPEHHLFLLSTQNPRPNEARFETRTSAFQITAHATLDNVRAVLTYVAGIAATNDTLWIYTTGHGTKENQSAGQWHFEMIPPRLPPPPVGEPFLCLKGPGISQTDFAGCLREFAAADIARMIYIGDVCFGGAFLEAVTNVMPRHVAISTTDARHVTWCGGFAPAFWTALANTDSRLPLATQLQAAFEEARSNYLATVGGDYGRPQFAASPAITEPAP